MKTEVYTKVNKEKVVLFMHHYLRLIAKYSDLEILEACGRLDTNCFEVRSSLVNKSTWFCACYFLFSSIHPAQLPLEQTAMTGS